MADLRTVVEGLGYGRVQTVLASGNVVFAGRGGTTATVERRLHLGIARATGLVTGVFVRTSQEWTDVIAHNPFPEVARADPSHLLVVPLRGRPGSAELAALRAAIRGSETVDVWDRHAYLVYPDGIGRSKLTLTLLERTLGSEGTARNWNTASTLQALAAERA